MHPEVEARLLNWPVREIPLDDLRDWYFAASDNPFPRPVMKWFLPRILELIADGRELASVGHEVALRRLHDSGFPADWPDAAVDLVNRFAVTLAVTTVVCPKTAAHPIEDRATLDETLCLLGQGGVDMALVLAKLDTLPTEVLAGAFGRDWALMGHEISINAFWESGPAKDMVLGWYTSDAMFERMMEHGVADAGEHRVAALNFADAILRWREMGES